MPKKDKQVKELLEDASDFYAKNQYKEALKKYNEVLELDKDNNEAIFKKYVIEAYETTYARFEVERIVNKLIEIAPSCDNETLFKYGATFGVDTFQELAKEFGVTFKISKATMKEAKITFSTL